MKKHIPKVLIYSRLVIGFAILALSILSIKNYSTVAITFFGIGLLTDIFDGIIARHLNISTQKLRRLDAAIDQVFYIAVTLATYVRCPAFFKEHALQITVLLGLEALTYVVSFLKFRKEIATHSIGAKIWSLLLFATLVQVMLQCQSAFLFNACLWVGIVTRLEIIAIIFTLKKWANDVPTIYHAVMLRQGKAIKRHKLFNG